MYSGHLSWKTAVLNCYSTSDCSRPEWIWELLALAIFSSSILFMSCKSSRLNLTNWEIAPPPSHSSESNQQNSIKYIWSKSNDRKQWKRVFFVISLAGREGKCSLPTGTFFFSFSAFSLKHKVHIYGALGPRYGVLKMMAAIHPRDEFSHF